MMRRLTSGPKPSARLRRYIRTSGLSSCGQPALVAGFFQRCPLGGQLGEHFFLVGAMAVVHAVVAGQIARCLARGDDVIRGHAIFAVRQRNLVDLGPERFVDVAPPRARPLRLRRRGPAPKCSRTRPSRKPGQRLANRLRVLGHRPIDRRRIHRIVAGDHFQAAAPRPRRCGPRGRSGRGCWQRPPGRSG